MNGVHGVSWTGGSSCDHVDIRESISCAEVFALGRLLKKLVDLSQLSFAAGMPNESPWRCERRGGTELWHLEGGRFMRRAVLLISPIRRDCHGRGEG